MPRRTIILPIVLSLLTSSSLMLAVVFAQDVPGGPTTDSNTQDPFNACILDVCEPQRARCVASAGSDAALLGLCETYVNQCLESCRAGNTGYVFPPLPAPEPEPVLEPEPEPVPEPIPAPVLETEPVAAPLPEPEAEPEPVPEPEAVLLAAPEEEESESVPAEPEETRQEDSEAEEETDADDEQAADENEAETEAPDDGLSDEERDAADERVRELVDADAFERIPGITSLSEEGEDEAEWLPSQEEPGQDVSEYVILIGDADDDGLPDAIEDEIPEGDPTAEALASGAPLGQPDGAGEEDPDFTVGNDEQEDDAFVLRGRCEADAVCLIYVYSYIPVVLAVKTDASGNFVYDISDYVGSGQHVAYVTVTDKTGKIARKSSPFSFAIEEAQAADAPEALPALDVDVEASASNHLLYYILGAGGLILVGVGLALSLRKRTP